MMRIPPHAVPAAMVPDALLFAARLNEKSSLDCR
jgi:hypothetical protein